MTEKKVCTKCGQEKTLDTDNFNLLSSGSWRGTCKKCMALNTKRHYENNPQKVKDRASKYNSQKKLNGGNFKPSDVFEIRNKLLDTCYYCGISLDGGGELDHKVPISRGGSNSVENLTLACRKCNRDKHSKTDVEFITWRGELGLEISKSIDNNRLNSIKDFSVFIIRRQLTKPYLDIYLPNILEEIIYFYLAGFLKPFSKKLKLTDYAYDRILKMSLIELYSRYKLSTITDECSGLMYPDTDLGENARHGEVFDEQAETYVFPGVQTAGSMSGVGSRI